MHSTSRATVYKQLPDTQDLTTAQLPLLALCNCYKMYSLSQPRTDLLPCYFFLARFCQQRTTQDRIRPIALCPYCQSPRYSKDDTPKMIQVSLIEKFTSYVTHMCKREISRPLRGLRPLTCSRSTSTNDLVISILFLFDRNLFLYVDTTKLILLYYYLAVA
jgi:hypothetical protein